jgi:hypothetical protein
MASGDDCEHMGLGRVDHRYPAGTGWAVGYLLGSVFGVTAWVLSEDVVLGVVVLAATGPALGVAIEQSIDTRPLNRARQRYLWLLAGTGVVVGVVALGYVVLS